MDDKIFNETLKAYRSGNIRWKNIRDKYFPQDVSPEIVRSRFKNARKSRGIPSNAELSRKDAENVDVAMEYPETIEMKANGVILSDKLIMICEEELKNPNRLLELHNFDPTFWEVTYAKNNLWHMNQGGGERLLCYQSKVTAKPRKEPQWDKKSIDRVFEDLKNISFDFPKPKKYRETDNGKALVVSIADLHLGLYSTMETNNNDYNMEIAEHLFLEAVDKIIQKVENKNIEEILFVIGNDFLNSDGLTNSTTLGTVQDSAAFWFELVDKAIELIIIATNEFLKIAPVKIYNVIANHDAQSMYAITKVIEATYKDNENVFIDASPLPRKYYRFGKSVVGLSHDLRKNIGLEVFTTEAQEYWSSCKNFYFLLAHLHTAMIYESKGKLEIHRSPTISGFSRWSNGKAFVSSKRMTRTFVLDKENGIEEILDIVVG